MSIQLGGLHHVTAVTGHAAENLAFYTQVLGMRLVKKTVNQDDVTAYHLFYGDSIGHAGTELTFFDWPLSGPRRPGTGTIDAISLRVPDADALRWWDDRFTTLGVTHSPIEKRLSRPTLPFTDPEGQRLELVAPMPGEAEPVAGGEPWLKSPVPAAYQIRGLHAVRMIVARAEMSELVLTQVMGFREAGAYNLLSEDGTVTQSVRVFQVGEGGPGAEVHLIERDNMRRGMVGIGGVHHVAFRTPTDEQHAEWRARLAEVGLGVTQVIDRFYFHSIYFREPGGVLFEIATDGPGFASDEDAEHLGESLALPPFLEPRRREIESNLRPLATPADSAASR